MRSTALFAIAFFSCGCTVGSPQSPAACTEIGCVSGFHVSLAASSWQPGKYAVVVVADGATTTCSATLPLSSTSTADCTGPGVQLGLSGSMLPAAQQSLSDVTLASTPKSVKVTVSRDGTELATKSFTPTYATSRPNGPDCEPVCTSASDTLALP